MSQKSTLIKFKVFDKQKEHDCYINGQYVVSVYPENDHLCWISLSNSASFLVKENVESVVAKLK